MDEPESLDIALLLFADLPPLPNPKLSLMSVELLIKLLFPTEGLGPDMLGLVLPISKKSVSSFATGFDFYFVRIEVNMSKASLLLSS
jgi:hypothetical protein